MAKQPQSGADSTADAQTGEGSTKVDTPAERVSKDEYKSEGKTVVATPRGYLFESSDLTIPVIDHEGLNMSAENAAKVIEESDKLVKVISDDKEGGNS